MRRGICQDCGKEKDLTKHSKKGGHKPPFIYICRKCHDIRHDIVQKRKNKKVQKTRLGKWSKKTKTKKNKR